jgi:poly-beta-1,6-N-acetyl-D-glucosamine synthase
LLPLILASNARLSYSEEGSGYYLLLVLQILFYVAALTAWVLPATRKMKLFLVPYYFVFMNLSLFRGFYRYIRHQQPVAWEKTERGSFQTI